jgi:hypothetical protein
MKVILNLILTIGSYIIRRGSGIFKFLFMIDDFFRVFTMTILFTIFFTWLGLGRILITLGALLGLIIDVQDFIAENEIAKFFD